MLYLTECPVIHMRGADGPIRSPRTMFSFNTEEDIKQYATGCDADIGGLSTVHFDLNTDPSINKPIGKTATGLFWGDMRLKVKPGFEKKIRGGYAGFRNTVSNAYLLDEDMPANPTLPSQNRPAFLFGNLLEDASNHEYLRLRLRVAGDAKTHNSYFVNIQTDGPISSDLWQHRLYFQKKNSWEEILVRLILICWFVNKQLTSYQNQIPFDNFVRTNSGEMSQTQIKMFREKIRTVGISILGGNSGVEGRYELGVDTIGLINEEDLDSMTSASASILLSSLLLHMAPGEKNPEKLLSDEKLSS